MISLFASLTGFVSAIFPELLRMSQVKLDRKHEIELLTKKIEMQSFIDEGKFKYLQEKADIEESKILHDNLSNPKSNIIDSLNHSVRPILAYSFFLLYGLIKIMRFYVMKDKFIDLAIINILWDQEDQAIFSAIISFYFGQRSLSKFRKGLR